MERQEPDNAAPTVLESSQLPTRQNKRRSSRNDLASKYEADIFGTLPSVWPTPSSGTSLLSSSDGEDDEDIIEPIDEQEIYDLIASIQDPEHPHTLGQLSVINLPDIHIYPRPGSPDSTQETLTQVLVDCTPTINHCSLATVIGLAVRVRLEQTLPPNYRVDVRMKAGSHSQDDQVSKQLSDKERVAAALENDTLMKVLNQMLSSCLW